MSSPHGQPGWQPGAYPGAYPSAYPAGLPSSTQRGTNGLAVASLITSLAGFFLTGGALGIVGAILGHVAMGQIRRTGEEGRGLALAGIIVGWVTFALLVVAVTLFIVFVVVLAGASTT